MKEKLKKYRKSNGLSEKEFAKKLNISQEKYTEIKKGAEIEDGLKEKIKNLISNTPRKRTAEIKAPKLPTGIADTSKILDSISSSTRSVIEMANRINKPLNQTLVLHNITNNFMPKSIAFDYLNDISKFSTSIKAATNNQLKAYSGLQSVFGNQHNIMKSNLDVHLSLLEDISKSSGSFSSTTQINNSPLFKTIYETVVNNKIAYENYIGFSSQLVNTISKSTISSSVYSNLISADNFIAKKPSILDLLSGSTFAALNDDDFEDEMDIIEQIENNPKYKEKADSIYNEFQQIVNDTNVEKVDEEKLKQLHEGFYLWIVEAFGVKIAKAIKIAIIMFSVLATILTFVSFMNDWQESRDNKIAYQKTLEELQKVKFDLTKTNDQNTEKLLKSNEEILERINSEPSQNMVALKDANLRTMRGSRSKIIAVISTSQKVVILEKKVKWIKVIYVDTKDNKLKSGWTEIENFK